MLTVGRGWGVGEWWRERGTAVYPLHTHRSWHLLEPRRLRFSRKPRVRELRPPWRVRRGPDLDLGGIPEALAPLPMGSEFFKFSAQSFEPRHPSYPG